MNRSRNRRSAHLRLDAQLWAVVRTEQLGVAIRGLHVVVAREHPEPRIVVASKVGPELLPVNRRLIAQGREDVVREAAPEDLGVGEVDLAHDGIVARNRRPQGRRAADFRDVPRWS